MLNLFFTGRRDGDVPHEISNLIGQLRLLRTLVDDAQNSMTWDQVTLANASQLGDYKVVIPKASDHISRSPANMVGVML